MLLAAQVIDRSLPLVFLNRNPLPLQLARVVKLARQFSFYNRRAHRDRTVGSFELKRQATLFKCAVLKLRVTELRAAAAGNALAVNFQRQQEWKRLTVRIRNCVPLTIEINGAATGGGSRSFRSDSSSRRDLLQSHGRFHRSMYGLADELVTVHFDGHHGILAKAQREHSVLEFSVRYISGHGTVSRTSGDLSTFAFKLERDLLFSGRARSLNHSLVRARDIRRRGLGHSNDAAKQERERQ